jgi:outer membrane lipoprotein-sorting protein
MNLLARRVFLCAALTSLLASPVWTQTAPSTPFALAQLMQTLGAIQAGEANFTEKRYVAMLERTLESSGTLAFAAPDTLVRATLKPRAEKLAVVGNNVTLSLGARSRTVALDATPEAAVIVQAIRGTLTGNQVALEEHFTPSVSGTAARWTLNLLPRAPKLRELVVAVRVQGRQAEVNQVSVTMADGDSSVMTITPFVTTKTGTSK